MDQPQQTPQGADWTDPQQAETRPPGQRGHGLADGIGSADDSTGLSGDIQVNIKQFFGRIKGSVLYAFAAVSAITLLVGALQMVVNIGLLLGEVYSAVAIVGGLFTGLVVLIEMVAAVVQAALYRPARNLMMVTQEPGPASFKEALGQAKGALVPALLINLILGVAMGLGISCCVIPGVIAFVLLVPARYLAVARGMDVGDALSASMDVGKKYWLLMVGLLVASMFIFGLAGGITTAATTAMAFGSNLISQSSPTAGAILGPMLGFLGTIIQWAVGLAAAVAYWSLEGGIMATIETEEYGEQVAL